MSGMLGIDVSKGSLSCAFLEAATQEFVWEATISNTPQQIAALIERTPPESAWILEPTGRYGLNVVQLARQAGRTVLLAPPRKAKSFMASLPRRAKNDRLDSQGLALMGLSLSHKLAPYPLKSELVDEIDQLLSARKGLSRSVATLTLQARELPYAREALKQAKADLKARMKALDKRLASLVAGSPELKVVATLKKVEGIGPVTATAVAACLTNKQFSHPDKFVAFIGLDVEVRDSGTRKGTRRLTHQGNAELRRLLYLAAQASLRTKEGPFKAQYEREREKGLPSTAALCAVARKMAKLCWSLHKHGTDYDSARVYQQPKKKTEQKTEANAKNP